MAVIHRASLVPSKLELIDRWLATQPWDGGGAELRRVGSYRFDDPDGEVGVEGLLVARGEMVFHVLLTYRGAPLEGADEWLIGTMEHSVLGTRWVYDGVGDPVAVAALARAMRGEQDQAALELHDGDTVVGHQEADVRVWSRAAAAPPIPAAGPAPATDDGICEVDRGGAQLRVVRVLGAALAGEHELVAKWRGGEAVVAAEA